MFSLEIKLKGIYSFFLFFHKCILYATSASKPHDWSTQPCIKKLNTHAVAGKRWDILWQHVPGVWLPFCWDELRPHCSAADQSHSKTSGNITSRCMGKSCWNTWYARICQRFCCGSQSLETLKEWTKRTVLWGWVEKIESNSIVRHEKELHYFFKNEYCIIYNFLHRKCCMPYSKMNKYHDFLTGTN